ncbi:MAG TPA: DUF3347 domain-containing protein [Parafilimonas sp.]|nr:DUF3347 domain-containing protein [Parafilimonas sp.]
MKKTILSAIIVCAIVFTACNSSESKNEHEGHDMENMAKDSTEHAATEANAEVKTVAVTFSNVDAKAAASIKEIVDHYLHVKNALTNDNDAEAASGGKAMAAAISKLDKSLLTAEQKKVFDETADDLKEHAEHIGDNAGNIKHQREHFVGMSEDVYALVTAFGGGRALYNDHCPMAQENKGAMWISETKEIKNPYFGTEMPTCGNVQEVIQ